MPGTEGGSGDNLGQTRLLGRRTRGFGRQSLRPAEGSSAGPGPLTARPVPSHRRLVQLARASGHTHHPRPQQKGKPRHRAGPGAAPGPALRPGPLPPGPAPLSRASSFLPPPPPPPPPAWSAADAAREECVSGGRGRLRRPEEAGPRGSFPAGRRLRARALASRPQGGGAAAASRARDPGGRASPQERRSGSRGAVGPSRSRGAGRRREKVGTWGGAGGLRPRAPVCGRTSGCPPRPGRDPRAGRRDRTGGPLGRGGR